MTTKEDFQIITSGLFLLITGLIEGIRVWKYYQNNETSLHFMYRAQIHFVENREGPDAAQAYKRELESEWWKKHGVSSLLYSVTAILGTIYLIASYL